jgi:Domain of unknown function (DUF4396)
MAEQPGAQCHAAGFALVTLYMGPLGLLLYVLADKEPKPGTHENFVQPIWKQGIGSTIHCVAGDATGIILAAAITASLGLPMWIDVSVEYTAGFAFGPRNSRAEDRPQPFRASSPRSP